MELMQQEKLITLEELKNAIADVKEDFYGGNDSRAEYRGACESLDMLIGYFENAMWEVD
mgnify:CR=1 FL=1|tara:strand:- start:449 stop:625 length:177 start_codon:yes stop_codon:yes gene_type:complete